LQPPHLQLHKVASIVYQSSQAHAIRRAESTLPHDEHVPTTLILARLFKLAILTSHVESTSFNQNMHILTCNSQGNPLCVLMVGDRGYVPTAAIYMCTCGAVTHFRNGTTVASAWLGAQPRKISLLGKSGTYCCEVPIMQPPPTPAAAAAAAA
jgi:hypothetical protein